MPKLNLLVDFNETFRICQKWVNLQITRFLLLIRIGIRKIFRICNLEYPNSKTYWWILMTISEHVRNGPNYQVTNLLCLSGSVSGKYCGLLIRNVQTKKYHWWMLVKFQYFYQKWAKLQIKRFFPRVSGLHGSVSRKYSGLAMRNVKTQKITGWFCWKLHAISEMEQISYL